MVLNSLMVSNKLAHAIPLRYYVKPIQAINLKWFVSPHAEYEKLFLPYNIIFQSSSSADKILVHLSEINYVYNVIW